MSFEVSDDQARLIRDCVTEMMLRRRHTGQPIPERVRSLLSYVSARGHQSCTETAQSEDDEADHIGTAEAATILRCTTRTITRIATDLDGRKVGRDWIFVRRNVIEYAEGKRE